MVLCDTVPGCVDVSFVRKSGGACYLKNGLGKTVKDDRILAGRLLVPGGNGPSAASISTTTSTSSTATTSSPASETTSISVPVTTAGPSSSKISTSTTSTSSLSRPSTTTSALPISSYPAIGSYNYAGCWADNAYQGLGRALRPLPRLKNTTSMTPTLCASYCTQYAYFGVEYGSECWCGPYLSNTTQTPQSDCAYPCSGDAAIPCGAIARLSLYQSNDPVKITSDPIVPGPTMGNYTYAACYTDSANSRLLPNTVSSSNMTTAACLALAEVSRYVYAGLEYGQECWIGNSLGNAGVNVKMNEGECGMSCVGARRELCGGALRMNVWVRNGGV